MSVVLAASAIAAQSPIDLAVDRVWVGKDCKIKVRLVRRGAGRLPESVASAPALRITVGKREYGFTFDQVDPKHVLLKGPSAVVFPSPIRVSSKAAITAKVDPRSLFPETSESNNLLGVAKFPSKCIVAAANLNWIQVRDVYLRKGRLHAVLAFTSKAAIKSGELSRVVMDIRTRTGRGTWPLAQVYHQAKQRGMGLVEFNTNLAVKPGTQVKLGFKRGKLAKAQVYTLAKPAKKPKAKGPSGSGGPGVPISINRGIAIIKPTSRKVVHRGGTVSVMYALHPDAPGGYIEFALYRGPQKFNSVQVNYIPPTGSEPRERQFEFPIPGNVAYGGGYYIKGVRGGLWGDSDEFSIREAAPQWGPAGGVAIHVLAPSGPGELVHHGLQTISWRVTGDYQGDPAFDVSLVQGDDTIATISSRHMEFNEASGTYTLAWTVPSMRHRSGSSSTLQGEGFRIKVADRNSSAEGISNQAFSIGPRQPEWALNGGITISQPRRGNRYSAGDPLVVEWEFNPQAIAELGHTPDSAYVAVYKANPGAGRAVFVWGESSSSRRVSWTIPPNQEPGDYFVEVRHNPPNTLVGYLLMGASGVFRIVPRDHLEITWPPRSRTTPISLSVFISHLIRWDALGAARDATIDIILSTRQAGLGSIYLRRNVPASDGQWRWDICPTSYWIHFGTHFQIILRTNSLGDNNLRSGSDYFNITQPSLEIRRPRASQSWPLGENRPIHWRNQNIPASKRLRIDLMKGNESFQDIARQVPVSDERFVYLVGSTPGTEFSTTPGMGGAPPPPPGCDYRVRLSVEGCFALKWYSPYFCLR